MEPTNQLVADATSMKFAALLSEGLKYVDSWTPTEINMGGCGIFAKELSDRLTKAEIPHKIVALAYDEGDESMANLKNYVTTNKGELTGVNHIVVLVADCLYVDSTGIVNIAVLRAFERLEISRKVLDQMLLSKEWGQAFDRTCIPLIETKLDEVFTHLVDFHIGMF